MPSPLFTQVDLSLAYIGAKMKRSFARLDQAKRTLREADASLETCKSELLKSRQLLERTRPSD